ncbi:MAG: type II secretion system protein [Phycisphaerae bacterium]|jgi:general secretion pathway protein G|nr:type II secretion system protein [Phycisphaerae bacterium]
MNLKKTVFRIVHTLIVAVMLSILGYSLISQWGPPVMDAKFSNLATNLQSIRTQLRLYKRDHNGKYPTDITAQLTGETDPDGTINPSGAYGPYFRQFPRNPFVDDPVEGVKTSGGSGEGWSYDSVTGMFRANTAGHEDL